MKTFVLTFLLPLFALQWANAQGDITPKVSEALKKGDANSLAAFFMPQVDVTLNEEDQSLTSAQAKSAITAFFATNPVQNFVVKHQGTSKLDDQYRIGDLTTAKGVFRVTFFMKKNNGAMQIKQIKFE
jgi:hypothetical protein